ncbi:hypothetical protein G6F46_012166 [Rhizopus delemar]|uniref:Uncharacterized protein n=2 Tax=Rhizopus TaxID=4842 RepID=A0A9P7CIW7_9FUNG|nr:hypothetical protein G6F55_011219 [Rhizopus delemar]KAG1535704.1 hypothetical protein G6F51_011390 [Rhizopus arrhizus]KAG1491430.1 hypothetical protein G6F54_010025 [Rhizopus delemar]KAG1511976.1 hypothetical protein G6F53_005535 [Rhizopus delemar]KAG1514754.1 hypothetical protein G6F52_009846 [Rhizopus delemar]
MDSVSAKIPSSLSDDRLLNGMVICDNEDSTLCPSANYTLLTSTRSYNKCGSSSTGPLLIFFLDLISSSQTICARGLLRSGHLPTTTLVQTKIQMQK